MNDVKHPVSAQVFAQHTGVHHFPLKPPMVLPSAHIITEHKHQANVPKADNAPARDAPDEAGGQALDDKKEEPNKAVASYHTWSDDVDAVEKPLPLTEAPPPAAAPEVVPGVAAEAAGLVATAEPGSAQTEAAQPVKETAEPTSPVPAPGGKVASEAVSTDPADPIGSAAPNVTPTVVVDILNVPNPASAAQESSAPDSAAAAAAAATAGDKKRKADAADAQEEELIPLTSPARTRDNSSAVAVKKVKTTNGGTRLKKEKKPLPPVGRTARKTRSQGPPDA